MPWWFLVGRSEPSFEGEITMLYFKQSSLKLAPQVRSQLTSGEVSLGLKRAMEDLGRIQLIMLGLGEESSILKVLWPGVSLKDVLDGFPEVTKRYTTFVEFDNGKAVTHLKFYYKEGPELTHSVNITYEPNGKRDIRLTIVGQHVTQTNIPGEVYVKNRKANEKRRSTRAQRELR